MDPLHGELHPFNKWSKFRIDNNYTDTVAGKIANPAYVEPDQNPAKKMNRIRILHFYKTRIRNRSKYKT